MTSRTSLRRSPEAWQIEDDDAARATVAAIEALGLTLAELFLRRLGGLPFDTNTQLALKGLGTTAGTVGASRLNYLRGRTRDGEAFNVSGGNRDEEIAGDHVAAVLAWLLDFPLNPDDPPELRKPSDPPPSVALALDELHAAAIYFHRRASNAGIRGAGTIRATARQTTRTATDGR